MALNSKFIITLQFLCGIGNKKILEFSERIHLKIETFEDFWAAWNDYSLCSIKYHDMQIAYQKAEHIIKESQKEGIGILSYSDQEFPSQLKHCINKEGKEDPVILIYYRGNLKVLQKPSIAIIGTKEPTANGIKAGEYIASELAKKNFNIISTLEIGCDTIAHRGTLNAEGSTTAILANGLDWNSIHPQENQNLAKEIVAKGGLLLSIYPIGYIHNRYSLVNRYSLQSALSFATIAIQIGIIGHMLYAIKIALITGKLLFAVEYKTDEDTKDINTQGNILLLLHKNVYPLRTDTIDEALKKIDDYMDN